MASDPVLVQAIGDALRDYHGFQLGDDDHEGEADFIASLFEQPMSWGSPATHVKPLPGDERIVRPMFVLRQRQEGGADGND